MSPRKKRIIIILSVLLAFAIILLTAKAIADNATHINTPAPTITASPNVTLKEPEPPINASAEVKLPQAEPEVDTVPAPPTAPDNIPFDMFVSTPQYVGPVAPIPAPQMPLPAPQWPSVAPIVPSPVQPLIPEVTGPVEGLLEPLAPITDPLLDKVKGAIPAIPPIKK